LNSRIFAEYCCGSILSQTTPTFFLVANWHNFNLYDSRMAQRISFGGDNQLVVSRMYLVRWSSYGPEHNCWLAGTALEESKPLYRWLRCQDRDLATWQVFPMGFFNAPNLCAIWLMLWSFYYHYYYSFFYFSSSSLAFLF
jgi:hypothetical protein